MSGKNKNRVELCFIRVLAVVVFMTSLSGCRSSLSAKVANKKASGAVNESTPPMTITATITMTINPFLALDYTAENSPEFSGFRWQAPAGFCQEDDQTKQNGCEVSISLVSRKWAALTSVPPYKLLTIKVTRGTLRGRALMQLPTAIYEEYAPFHNGTAATEPQIPVAIQAASAPSDYPPITLDFNGEAEVALFYTPATGGINTPTSGSPNPENDGSIIEKTSLTISVSGLPQGESLVVGESVSGQTLPINTDSSSHQFIVDRAQQYQVAIQSQTFGTSCLVSGPASVHHTYHTVRKFVLTSGIPRSSSASIRADHPLTPHPASPMSLHFFATRSLSPRHALSSPTSDPRTIATAILAA